MKLSRSLCTRNAKLDTSATCTREGPILTHGLDFLEQPEGALVVLAVKAGRQQRVALIRARLSALCAHALPQAHSALYLPRLRSAAGRAIKTLTMRACEHASSTWG